MPEMRKIAEEDANQFRSEWNDLDGNLCALELGAKTDFEKRTAKALRALYARVEKNEEEKR